MKLHFFGYYIGKDPEVKVVEIPFDISYVVLNLVKELDDGFVVSSVIKDQDVKKQEETPDLFKDVPVWKPIDTGTVKLPWIKNTSKYNITLSDGTGNENKYNKSPTKLN